MAAPPATSVSGGYKAKTERGQLAHRIVKKWAGYVSHVYGTDPGSWSRSMAGTFAEADISNMRKAAQKGTYEAMMGTLVGQDTTDQKIINAMARSDGSLVTVKTLGSPSEDLVYTMVNPCRIADTRVAGGRLSAGVVRSFNSSGANFTAQGGANSDCAMPSDASAVIVNVTAVLADGPGFLTLFPFNTTRPTASSLNYKGADIVANEVVVKQTLGQPSDFSVYSLAGTDVVIDVVGYFMAPEATALACVNETQSITLPANSTGTGTASCPTGYTVSGGGCNSNVNSNAGGVIDSYPSGNGWFCRLGNTTASASNGTTYARCCRVPGR